MGHGTCYFCKVGHQVTKFPTTARLFNTLFYLNVLRIIRIKPIIRNTFSAAKLIKYVGLIDPVCLIRY